MPHKVLLIDDDPLLRMVMEEAFRSAGFDPLCAEDGAVGLKRFDRERPDLVITDIVMPEKEGIATILELKQRADPPRIIAISGGGQVPGSMCLKWAAHLGADEVISKPFQLSALVAAARELLAH